MWIKICANTTLDDALAAARLGADALGFVFAPSSRRVTVEQVTQITPHLPDTVERIGVFAPRRAQLSGDPAFQTQDEDEIAEAAQRAGLTGVQLHGGFHAALPTRLRARLGDGMTIIQTLHWGDNTDAAELSRQLHEIAASGVVDRVLVDSRAGAALGGTGISFDWAAAREVFAEGAGRLKLIVAGGLRPENVTEAIRMLRPWGVDVASGVEAAPGRKDPEKLAAFIRNAQLRDSASVVS